MPKNKGKKKKNKGQNKQKPNKQNSEVVDQSNSLQDNENKDIEPIPEIKVDVNLDENKVVETSQNQNNEHSGGDEIQVEVVQVQDESINEDNKDSFNEADASTTAPVKKKRFSFLRKKMSASLHNVNTSSNDIKLNEMSEPQERGVQRTQSMSTFDREPKSKIPLYKSRSMKKQKKNNLTASTSNVDSTSLVLNPGMDDWRMSGLLNNVEPKAEESPKASASVSITPSPVVAQSKDEQKENESIELQPTITVEETKEEPESAPDEVTVQVETPAEEPVENNIEQNSPEKPTESTESGAGSSREEIIDSESTPQLIDATTDAELYEFENENKVVMVQKLEDVLREKKMVLPEDIISSDWLVLNLANREIPTF
ncbi:glutamic acid-rich protein-like [Clytia hemisphaerica]|uniref:Uncharacterized protein n=1 Tax=Clytia hemisphaerica TaxID=252671 RepID=A0A7M5WXZ3_9CNID|eukprot:TCONS_00058325-protein